MSIAWSGRRQTTTRALEFKHVPTPLLWDLPQELPQDGKLLAVRKAGRSSRGWQQVKRLEAPGDVKEGRRKRVGEWLDSLYGSGLSFRDPDNIALELFAPPS